jgi:hypothetical protein
MNFPKHDMSDPWKHLCSSIMDSTREFKLTCPKHAEQAQIEADNFCKLPVPQDTGEMLLRHAMARSINNKWENEFIAEQQRK